MKKDSARRMPRMVTIRLDEQTYRDLKAANIDMSAVCREALERAIYRAIRALGDRKSK